MASAIGAADWSDSAGPSRLRSALLTRLTAFLGVTASMRARYPRGVSSSGRRAGRFLVGHDEEAVHHPRRGQEVTDGPRRADQDQAARLAPQTLGGPHERS